MNRRSFIKSVAPAVVLIANGKISQAGEEWFGDDKKKKVKLRFVVASDGHYGQPGTDFENYFALLVRRINEEHAKDPFAFAVINGDIIHDDRRYLSPAKNALDNLAVKYYVSQGNHDSVPSHEWESHWGMPMNVDFSIKKVSMLIATTSNEEGKYLCPDLRWFREKLELYKNQEQIFIFLHINPGKLTKYGVDCPEFFELLAHYPNVKAVFNGHDHDEDGIKVRGKIPFIFDAHFGGSWGTTYRGFRVVELMKDNTLATYVMNPAERINMVNV